MLKSTTLRAPPTNRLLAAVPTHEYRRLLPDLEPFPLVFMDWILLNPGKSDYVLFAADKYLRKGRQFRQI